MERGYSSNLTKETLAYNLAYHLKETCGLENAHEIVIKVLSSFEYKENSKSNENK